MSEIKECDLNKYYDKEIYIYHSFQITPATILSITHNGSPNNNVVPLFTIFDNHSGNNMDTYFPFAKYYETFRVAQFRQALDIYKILTGKFRTDNKSLRGMVEFYERFIDYKDLEFFILETTKYQLDEKGYREIIKEISEKNPEYLI